MPSVSNAAFQAQLAAAVDSAGIVNRGESTYMADTATEITTSEFTESAMDGEQSGTSARSMTDDSQLSGHNSRASWESDPPFQWTGGDALKHEDQVQIQDAESYTGTSESTHESSFVDSQAPVQIQLSADPTPPVSTHHAIHRNEQYG